MESCKKLITEVCDRLLLLLGDFWFERSLCRVVIRTVVHLHRHMHQAEVVRE